MMVVGVHARVLLGQLRGAIVVQVHPVSLGIFNFVNAWSMMFWPVMLADRKGQGVEQRFPLWLGTQAWLCSDFFASDSSTLAREFLW